MARMYPGTPVVNPQLGRVPEGEEEVFHILRDKLPDEWIVMHSVKDNEGKINYEADFVVLVPHKGILILEVKSHKEADIRAGVWWEYDQEAKEPKPMKKETPLDQAFLASKQFIDGRVLDETVEERPHPNGYGKIFTPRLRYRSAAILTNIETLPPGGEMPMGKSARKAILTPKKHYICGLAKLKELDLKELFESYFGTESINFVERPWHSAEFDEAIMQNIRNAVKPSCGLGLDPELYRSYMERSARRAAVLLEATSASWADVSVSGCAGSGKTVMLVKEAKRLYRQAAREGKPLGILVLCYNKVLADSLKAQFADCPATGGCSIEVSSFHSFAMKELKAFDSSWDFDKAMKHAKQNQDAVFAEAAALFISHLSLRGAAPRHFDHIFIDEAQDFDSGWFSAFPAYREANPVWGWERGRLYYFSDSNQTLYKKRQGAYNADTHIPDTPMKMSLLHNLRNARQIAQFNSRSLKREGVDESELPIPLESLYGKAVDIRDEAEPAERREMLRQLLRRLIEEEHVNPSDIAVLSPYKKNKPGNSFIPADSRIRFSTIRSFKGLEADHVILTDIAPNDSGEQEDVQSFEDFYVASSRAKYALYILPAPGGKARLDDWLAEAEALEEAARKKGVDE